MNSLNNLIDEILIDKERQKKLDYGKKLAGDVTQEFQLDEEAVTKSGWLNFLSTCFINGLKLKLGKKLQNLI